MRCAKVSGSIRSTGKVGAQGIESVAPLVLPYMDSVWSLLEQKRREGKRILFEGAQGALSTSIMAPIRSSPPRTPWRPRPRPDRARPGSNRLRARHLSRPTPPGSAKVRFRPSRTTKSARTLGERGKEFGVVTGRPRRCGWFDAVLVRQTVRTCGIDGLALTKLDILDGFDEIKVCVGYQLDGREIDYLPAGEHVQARVAPIYETIAGWREKTARARSWAICRRRRSNTCAGSRN